MMKSPVKQIRSAARAVVVCEGNLLAIKMRDRRGVFYILPGGGQNPGETLVDAVQRECREEAGLQVKVKKLLYVREYIGKNHDFSRRHAGFHQIEHVFLCEVDDPEKACPGHETDNLQVGVNWLALESLSQIRFYPEAVKGLFNESGFIGEEIYLGDCN